MNRIQNALMDSNTPGQAWFETVQWRFQRDRSPNSVQAIRYQHPSSLALDLVRHIACREHLISECPTRLTPNRPVKV